MSPNGTQSDVCWLYCVDIIIQMVVKSSIKVGYFQIDSNIMDSFFLTISTKEHVKNTGNERVKTENAGVEPGPC